MEVDFKIVLANYLLIGLALSIYSLIRLFNTPERLKRLQGKADVFFDTYKSFFKNERIVFVFMLTLAAMGIVIIWPIKLINELKKWLNK